LQHLQTILGQNQSSEFFVLFEQKYILGASLRAFLRHPR